jgi:hypothetical protein
MHTNQFRNKKLSCKSKNVSLNHKTIMNNSLPKQALNNISIFHNNNFVKKQFLLTIMNIGTIKF